MKNKNFKKVMSVGVLSIGLIGALGFGSTVYALTLKHLTNNDTVKHNYKLNHFASKPIEKGVTVSPNKEMESLGISHYSFYTIGDEISKKICGQEGKFSTLMQVEGNDGAGSEDWCVASEIQIGITPNGIQIPTAQGVLMAD